MPEGHTIHKAARDQMRDLGGEAIHVTSPQGRPESVAAAAALDGRRLHRIDAYGKHLFYRFAPRDQKPVRAADLVTLHVHLGLFGKFFRQATPAREPRGLKRLRMIGERWTIDLSGPTACDLLPPPLEDKILARLGPDPLRRDGDPQRFVAALARRKISIAEALMDQKVIAGVGNVFRAEALHALRLDPHRPASALGEERALELWDWLKHQLERGVKTGKIITIPDPPKTATARNRLPRLEGRSVYKRPFCRACGGPVTSEPLAGRTLWWCPAEQTG